MADRSYSPSSMGSTWSYEGKTAESTFDLMTGRTIKKFNKTYFEKQVTAGTKQFYYYGSRAGNNYYAIVTDPNNINAENEVLYLKADAAVNESWVSEIKYGADLLGGQWTFKIIEKGISKIVNGKLYSDVIHTQRYSGGITVDSYYSLGIGLIEVDYDSGASSTLIDFDIK